MVDSSKRDVLLAVARDAGIVDHDAINIPEFGKAVADFEAGKIDEHRAIDQMRAMKPSLFKSWNDMDDPEFSANEQRLRENNRGRVARPFPQELRGVDVSTLSDEAFEQLEHRLRKVR